MVVENNAMKLRVAEPWTSFTSHITYGDLAYRRRSASVDENSLGFDT